VVVVNVEFGGGESRGEQVVRAVEFFHGTRDI
jgi:hypothetical protein